tara:strand:+ start:302 stop:826 length:525 start_codon:yes stop_codon:yes gene_type:complete
MMFNPFNTGGRGIASLIQPLLMGIGSQINQSTNTQLNDFGQKVEQLVSESFPELEMNQPMGMQVARPIQAQNRNRFLSMFSPQTRPQTRPLRPLEPQDGPALPMNPMERYGDNSLNATPKYFPMIPGVLTQDMNSASSYSNLTEYLNRPQMTPSAMRSAFGGISSLAQMLPRAI